MSIWKSTLLANLLRNEIKVSNIDIQKSEIKQKIYTTDIEVKI
jgi:hypothetical protein